MKSKLFGVVLVCVLHAAPAKANTYTFWTFNGATAGTGLNSRSVAAQVTFITTANHIEIDVTNLQTEIQEIWQTISAVDFLVQGVSGVNPTGIAFQTGDANQGWGVKFNNATTLSPTTISLSAVSNPWTIATSTQLSGGTEIGAIHSSANSAKDLILGPGTYQASGNGSGTIQHTPNNEYLLTSSSAKHISWILSYADTAGITEDSSIASARLTFGLDFTSDMQEDLTLTPEPGTIAMMIGGIGLIVVGSWRRRRASQDIRCGHDLLPVEAPSNP